MAAAGLHRISSAARRSLSENRPPVGLRSSISEMVAVPITGKVQDVVQLTAQSYGINAEEQEGILKYLIEGGDLSLYGLSNAVTRASQDIVSYDRGTTLEGIGWQVATMEPQQWKQINQ